MAGTCSAGVALVMASPAIAGDPPPTAPTDAAIAQYVEAVLTETGPAPIGGDPTPAVEAAVSTAVRAKIERTAGADAPALLQVAQDPRFGARPVARAKPTRATPRHRADPPSAIPPQAVPMSMGAPSPLAAAASTAGSSGLLVVALLLVAITAAGIAARTVRR